MSTIDIESHDAVEISINDVTFYAVPIVVNNKPSLFIPTEQGKGSLTVEKSGGCKVVQSGVFINNLNVPDAADFDDDDDFDDDFVDNYNADTAAQTLNMPSEHDVNTSIVTIITNSEHFEAFLFDTNEQAQRVGETLNRMSGTKFAYSLQGRVIYRDERVSPA